MYDKIEREIFILCVVCCEDDIVVKEGNFIYYRFLFYKIVDLLLLIL